MDIPSEADWRSEQWWVDTRYAYDHFFGKDISEAIELFVENAIYYQEDIMWMPELCFRYYIHAYIDYLLSIKSKGDSDAASCFISNVEFRIDEIKACDPNLRERIADVLRKLGDKQEWYEADQDIYGDFMKRAATLLSKF